jgi:hypothetical protein
MRVWISQPLHDPMDGSPADAGTRSSRVTSAGPMRPKMRECGLKPCTCPKMAGARSVACAPHTFSVSIHLCSGEQYACACRGQRRPAGCHRHPVGKGKHRHRHNRFGGSMLLFHLFSQSSQYNYKPAAIRVDISLCDPRVTAVRILTHITVTTQLVKPLNPPYPPPVAGGCYAGCTESK